MSRLFKNKNHKLHTKVTWPKRLLAIAIVVLAGWGINLLTANAEGIKLAHVIGQSDTSPGYNYTASWLGSSTPTINNNELEPGQAYKLNIQLRKNTGGTDSSIKLTAHYHEAAAVFTPGAADQSTPAAVGRGLSVFHCTVGYSPCWYWEFSSFGGGQTATASFNFTVQPSALPGTQICFYVKAHSAISTDSVAAGEERCFTVAGSLAPANPYLSSVGGSIQSGAKWGDTPCLATGTGNVRGQNLATGSKADYVVSAGGSVSNFGSGGSPGGDNLTFANYGQVCRPDIAAKYINDSSIPNLPFNSLSVDDLADGIARYTGNVTITGGTVARGQRSTLVVNGNVYISGNINYANTNYSSVANIPSLGIVATGNIHIAPSVTALYGIYYTGSAAAGSTGIINTCQNGFGIIPNPAISAGGAAQCNNNLTVNGALIATNIYWRRTGGDANSAGSNAAETVNYQPQLLLRPPLGLGGVAGEL